MKGNSRNTVIGILSRVIHMNKKVLQSQCEECLGLLACEAEARVRNKKLQRDAAKYRATLRGGGGGRGADSNEDDGGDDSDDFDSEY